MRSHLPFPSLVALFVLALPSAAQSVYIVKESKGPGVDYLDIQPAIDAAQDGDTILVGSGRYSPVSIVAKGVTLASIKGDVVAVGGVFDFALVVRDLAPGQDVYLRGIQFEPGFLNIQPFVAEFVGNDAPIWLEDCSLTDSFGSTNGGGLSIDSCVGVSLTRCDIRAPFDGTLRRPGLLSVDSNLVLHETSVTGPRGNDGFFTPPAIGGDGLVVDGGSLYASLCTLTGGAGGDANFDLYDGAMGGDGLVLLSGAPIVRLLDPTLAGGAGGSGELGTKDGPDGSALNILSGTLEELDGVGRSLSVTSPLIAGASSIIETFTGVPGDRVLFAYSADGQIPGLYLPSLKGALVINPNLVVIHKGTIDSSGVLFSAVPTAPLPLGVESLVLTTQAAFLDPTGQGFFLSSPSLIVLINSAF